jgi:hypothetical protein
VSDITFQWWAGKYIYIYIFLAILLFSASNKMVKVKVKQPLYRTEGSKSSRLPDFMIGT